MTIKSADLQSFQTPRVLAIIPAKWLCDSWIVGPQVPAAESGPYSAYDRFVEKNFPGSLKYIDSETYDHWLFDRTTCWYKMYVRVSIPALVAQKMSRSLVVRHHDVDIAIVIQVAERCAARHPALTQNRA